MRRGSRRPLSRAARLTKEWWGFATFEPDTSEVQAATLAPGSLVSSFILSPQDALNAFDEPTVLRILVQVTPAFEAIGTNGLTVVSFGIIVADEAAVPAIGGATPDPLLNSDHDWLWRKDWAYVAPDTGAPDLYRYTFQEQWDDARAKRRIEAGQGLMFVATSNVASNANTRFWASGRVLLGH